MITQIGICTRFNSGRLALTRTYPNGCDPTAWLDTEFASYTPEGSAAKVADANGVWRSMDVHARFPSRLNGPGGEYLLEWEMGHLRQVREPSGALWVACYPGSGGPYPSSFPNCNRQWAGLSDKPVWVGRFTGGGGYGLALGTPLEHYRLSYSVDGTLSKVEFVDVYNSVLLPEQQKVLWSREFKTDAERRLSWSRIGVGGWFVANRYDAMHNLVARGDGYDFANPALPLNVPEYCQDGFGGVSGLCEQFQFDRLNRLTGVKRPSLTSSGADCLSYDAQGNVSRVERGCAASACTNNYTTTVSPDGQGNLTVIGGPNCSGAPIEYVWDDFGRLTSTRVSPQGETRLVYDARSQLVGRQTPQQRPADASWVASDALGRVTGITETSGGTSTILFARQYDSAPTLPSGCSGKVALGNLKGRLAYESAPVWNTWFGYDQAGRLTAELRVAPGGTCGSTENATWNSTQYAYWPDGRIQYMKYPYGRGLYYQYPTAGDPRMLSLPISISMDVYSSPTATTIVPIIDNITWRPDGQLASYRFRHYPSRPTSTTNPSFFTTVTRDYGSSDDVGVSLMEYIPTSCSYSVGSATRTDGTQRLRRVRADFRNFGDTSGIPWFDQWYTWRADEITSIDRCYYGQSTPLNEFRAFDGSGGRGYDGAGQLRFSSTVVAGGGVPETAREFRFDGRGNRTVVAFAQVPASGDVEGQVATFGGGGDGLTKLTAARVSATGATPLSANATRATRTFGLDQNGRIVTDATAVDTSGAANATTSFTFPFSGGATRGGIDSVIRGANVNGVNYNYFYDSMNRRTRKQYPTAVEEFFYDPTGHLLSERSFTYLTNSDGNTTDEYIWLGDVPVAMVRTLFTGAMVRTADWNGVPSNGSTVCPRRNEDARCATFFYLTDMQGRPTASIDKDSYLTGVGEYDAFGTINRVVQRAETAHPYSNLQNYNLVTQTGRDRFAYTLPMRARFSFVDTNAYYTCGSLSCADFDRAEVKDGETVKATVKGQHFGPAVTAWFTTSNDRFDVRWSTDKYGTLRDGVVFAGYEYQRVQIGGVRAFPPLRAPGQYFDEETGLHENRNRYYDPAAGRYLSPEPLLQSPGYVRTMAARGMQVPTYAYAANNPLRYVDSNGLYFTSMSSGAWASLSRLAANPEIGPYIEAMANDPVRQFQIVDDVPFDHSLGGLTQSFSKGSANINLYLPYTNSFSCKCDSGAPDELFPYSYDSLLAHELGHAYGNAYASWSSRSAAWDFAVRFEDAVRREQGAPQRNRHDYAQRCRQECNRCE